MKPGRSISAGWLWVLAGCLILAGCPSTGQQTPAGSGGTSTSNNGQINTVTAVPPAISPSESNATDDGTKKEDPVVDPNWAPHVDTTLPGTTPPPGTAPADGASLSSTETANQPDDPLAKHKAFIDRLKSIEVMAPAVSRPSSWNKGLHSLWISVAHADRTIPSFPGILTGNSETDDNTQGALFARGVLLSLASANELSATLLPPHATRYIVDTIYRDNAPSEESNLYFGSSRYGEHRTPAGRFYLRVYYNPFDKTPDQVWDGIEAGRFGQVFYRYYDGREDTRLHPELESTINLTNMSDFPVPADGRRCRQDTEPATISAAVADARPRCSDLGEREPDGTYTFALFDDSGLTSAEHTIGLSVVAKRAPAVFRPADNPACVFGLAPQVFMELNGDSLAIKMHSNGYPLPLHKARFVLHGSLPVTEQLGTDLNVRTIIDPGVVVEERLGPEGGDSYTVVEARNLNTTVDSCHDVVVTLARLATTRPAWGSTLNKDLVRAELFSRPTPPPGSVASPMPELLAIPYTYDGAGVSLSMLPGAP